MHKTTTLLLAAAALCWLLTPSNLAHGHSFMTKPFKARYELRSVTCYACHVKGEEKDVVSDFGEVLKKLLEGKDVAARAETLKDLEKEDREKLTEELTKDLTDALDELDKLDAPSGKKYAEAIKAGEIEGTKIKK